MFTTLEPILFTRLPQTPPCADERQEAAFFCEVEPLQPKFLSARPSVLVHLHTQPEAKAANATQACRANVTRKFAGHGLAPPSALVSSCKFTRAAGPAPHHNISKLSSQSSCRAYVPAAPFVLTQRSLVASYSG